MQISYVWLPKFLRCLNTVSQGYKGSFEGSQGSEGSEGKFQWSTRASGLKFFADCFKLQAGQFLTRRRFEAPVEKSKAAYPPGAFG